MDTRIANNLRRCKKCVLPETQVSIEFDKKGVCNICRQVEFKQKKIDWGQKGREFSVLLKKYRGKYLYDCIVPFSGGKDSTYTLWSLVKRFNLKPLVVSFDHGFLRPNLLENNERIFKKLGVDFLKFRPSWHIVKKLMLVSLIDKGDFCWHCHSGIFAYPMKVAIEKNIPLVIWGEPSSEYTAYYSYEDDEEVDEKRFNRFVNLGITAEDMIYRLDENVAMRDLEPFRYPSEEEFKKVGLRSVCLGSYFPWDTKKQYEIIKKELDWRGDLVEGMPPGFEWEKIECMFTGIRDYIIYLKTGFSRVTHLTSIEIRQGRLSREEASKLIEEYEGKRPATLDMFLKIMNLTEKKFNEIVFRHVWSPHVPEPKKIKKGKLLPDMCKWNMEE